MIKRWRARRVALAAIAAVGALVAGLLPVTPASADVTTQYIANDDNSSDPSIFRCTHPTHGSGWCMVTSEDLEQPPSGGNFYPMNRTLGYWSADGLRWDWLYTAINENQIPGVPAGSNHLWAPAVESDPDTGNYYLYVPDLTVAGNQLSSRIFVARSTDPINNYENQVLGQITGVPNVPNLYMSDPDVFRNNGTGERYLIWADGDNGTCGGISMRRMTSFTSVQAFNNPSDAFVTINGIGVLGSCDPAGPAGPIGRPYLEGATVYQFLREGYHQTPGGYPGGLNGYTMIFAAKPTSTPPECAAAGQPNSAHEVIAYATATTVTGPYTYQGILMCGSSTEWTNQATITEVQAANGDWRPMIVYHDGWSPATHGNMPSRRLHSECLYTMGAKFLNVRRTPDGAVNFPYGEREWCLQASTVFGLFSNGLQKYVRSDSAGVMKASATSVGTWEEFSLEGTLPTADGGTSTIFIRARNPELWVQANRNNDTVMARGQSSGSWEQFTVFRISAQSYALRDSENRWVKVDNSDGLLRTVATGSPSTPPGGAEYYFNFRLLTT